VHVFVVGLHTGVAALVHCELSVHCTQSPVFVPVVAQIPERQMVAPSLALQVASPLASPHFESFGSHVPLRHTPLGPEAFDAVHGPTPFGSPQILSATQTPLRHRSVVPPAVHVPRPGMGEPVVACGMQVFVVASQYCFAAQSLSTLQPVAGRHVPSVEQAPLWQTLGPVTVHGPSPFA